MRILAAFLCVLGLTLAGCSGGSSDDPGTGGTGVGNNEVLEVTKDTGGIRGVVVDQAIKPLSGAVVALSSGKNTTTGDDGLFTFTGLDAGDYFLSAAKPGYRSAQVSTAVVAGEAEPPAVRILLETLATSTPYLETYRLDGFYECTFALFFITDGCDFGYRTAWDEYNNTAPSPAPKPLPLPRTVQKFQNTQFITVPGTAFTIVQEGFWNDDTSPTFWIMLDETPIQNDCDCSTTYANAIGGPPLLLRMDRFTATGEENSDFRADFDGNGVVGSFPTDAVVAARGFIPFQAEPTDAAYALNMQFTLLTNVFHNVVPDAAWTFEARDQYPIGG